MSWKPEVDEINRRKALAEKMGGDEAVARHLKAGKLTARQRITKILDQASFKEIGALTGAAEYDEYANLDAFANPTASGGECAHYYSS